MIAFLMRILFKKCSSVFPAPSQDLFSFVPIPFFPSSELHIFLVTSPGWSAAWFFLSPMASWQVAADPAVDREPGGREIRGHLKNFSSQNREMKISCVMGLLTGEVIKFRDVVNSCVVKHKISYFTDFTICS